MRKSFRQILFACLAILLAGSLLAGCNYPGGNSQATEAGVAATSAAETVNAATTALANPAAATETQKNPPVPSTATPTPGAGETAVPTAAATETSNGVGPTATTAPGSGETQGGTEPDYLDDRSNAPAVIQSLFNAINRKEYLRAYSYWRDPASLSYVGSFEKFEKGYQDTASVQATIGTVTGDAGAGQLYYTVPVALKVQTTGGKNQTFAGCYLLHLSQPSVQATPPFQPLSIEKAAVKQASGTANPSDLAAHACEETDIPQGSPISPAPTTDSTTIAASNYLDDRSDAVVTLRSLFNAINRQEYLRAYSYWQNPAKTVGSFNAFQNGYAKTASVEATFGTVTPDAGAGQIYYSVPAALVAKTTDGKTQTFVGCYTLHLSQPTIQATPPFQPLGIASAHALQVANNANVNTLLKTACNTP